jgi:hypothetical protein
MKRILALAMLALGLSIAFVGTAGSAGVGDAQGPPCSNITNGDGSYSSAGVIDMTVFLQAPACPSLVTYSFFVTDTSGNAIAPVTTATQDSNCNPDPGGGCVHFVYDLGSGGPPLVCVYATTDIHGHVADRAPNGSDPSCPPSSPSFSAGRGGGIGASGGFN